MAVAAGVGILGCSNDAAVTKWSIHLRRRASIPATGSKQRTVAGFASHPAFQQKL
jgi:hypothetical protein